MVKANLRIDWATHAAAKYACENWHYSRSLPVGKMVKLGVWEGGEFIGVMLFAWGMNKSLGSPYGLKMEQCCELVRIALRQHKAPVSRMMAIGLKQLAKQSEGLRLVVSFADPVCEHHGGIYQATNWIYTGQTRPTFEWRLNGKRLNKRAYTGCQFGVKPRMKVPDGATRVSIQGKHRYLMPLDAAMRNQIAPLAKPYPMRVKQAMAGVQPEQRQCDTDPHAPNLAGQQQ